MQKGPSGAMKKRTSGPGQPRLRPSFPHRPSASDITSQTLDFLGREMGMAAMVRAA